MSVEKFFWSQFKVYVQTALTSFEDEHEDSLPLIPPNIPDTISSRDLTNELTSIIREQDVAHVKAEAEFKKKLNAECTKLENEREKKIVEERVALDKNKKEAVKLITAYCDIKLATIPRVEDVDADLSMYAEYSTLKLQADMTKVKTGTNSNPEGVFAFLDDGQEVTLIIIQEENWC